MSVAFQPGQTLGYDDLKICIRDNNGDLVDPYYIRYSIYDKTTGVEVLIGSQNRVPATGGTGIYYADFTVPLDANIGDWLIRWNFRETVGSPLIEAVQQFNVVSRETTVSVTGSDAADLLVRRLRIILRDNNPDRNYRFRPPSNERFLQAQTMVFGYIWEDEELYEYILMAIDDFNAAPPITGVTVDSIPNRWRTAIILRAGSFACFALAMNWIADEFSVKGTEKIEVKDEDGEIYVLTMEQLFEIVYGDLLENVRKNAKKEFKEGLKEIANVK